MSPKPRRKGRYQAPEKKSRHRRERTVPKPNVIVDSELSPEIEEASVASEVKETPAVLAEAVSPVAPEATNNPPLISELKQVGILGSTMIAVLVVLAIILG